MPERWIDFTQMSPSGRGYWDNGLVTVRADEVVAVATVAGESGPMSRLTLRGPFQIYVKGSQDDVARAVRGNA